MSRNKLVLSILGAAATLSFACTPSTTDLSSYESEIRCPPEGCDDPPEPPDDEPRGPRDPSDPPRPDPAKYRTAFIPVSHLKNEFEAFLADTRIQISHTGGEPLTVNRFEQNCTTHSNPDVEACKDECNAEPDLTWPQKAECRAACEATSTTCSTVCGAATAMSYLRWGFVALEASRRESPRTCYTNTCPACSTPESVPSLENKALMVPVFDKTYDLGLSHRIRCEVNRWVIHFRDNVDMAATPEGLFIRIAATTGTPAIRCEGAPDPEVQDLAVQLHFRLNANLIGADATLTGNWNVFGSVIDFVADLDDRISTAVTNELHDSLNTATAQDSYRKIFKTVASRWSQQEHNETLATMGSIYPEQGGIRVNYWVQ